MLKKENHTVLFFFAFFPPQKQNGKFVELFFLAAVIYKQRYLVYTLANTIQKEVHNETIKVTDYTIAIFADSCHTNDGNGLQLHLRAFRKR